jgi:hypothetical protein
VKGAEDWVKQHTFPVCMHVICRRQNAPRLQDLTTVRA